MFQSSTVNHVDAEVFTMNLAGVNHAICRTTVQKEFSDPHCPTGFVYDKEEDVKRVLEAFNPCCEVEKDSMEYIVGFDGCPCHTNTWTVNNGRTYVMIKEPYEEKLLLFYVEV